MRADGSAIWHLKPEMREYLKYFPDTCGAVGQGFEAWCVLGLIGRRMRDGKILSLSAWTNKSPRRPSAARRAAIRISCARRLTQSTPDA